VQIFLLKIKSNGERWQFSNELIDEREVYNLAESVYSSELFNNLSI
jgi:hypothetical protein